MRRRQISRQAKVLRRFSPGTCTACHKSPRGLLKTVPAGIAARLSAPALHHQSRNGRAAQLLPRIERGGRYALCRASRNASPAGRRRSSSTGKADRIRAAAPLPGVARSLSRTATGRKAGRRWNFAAGRARTQGPQRQAPGAAVGRGREAAGRRGCGPRGRAWPRRPQTHRQAEAEQARQAGRRSAQR